MNTLMLYPTIRQLMDNFFSDDMLNGTSPSFVPVNIKEKNDAWVIEMAVPGSKKENFKINLDNNSLKITYHHESENEEKKEEKDVIWHKRQFNAFSFERVFNLPENGIDPDKINAEYKDGVLMVSIPKNPVQNLVKTISIN